MELKESSKSLENCYQQLKYSEWTPTPQALKMRMRSFLERSVQEMLTFLESEEPLSNETNSVTKGAKSDSLSDAMARSRQHRQDKKDAKRQANATDEKGSKSKPGYLIGHKLKGFVDSLIKRDEDQVKAEIIENPSYRSSLYKAGRLAIKLGMTGLFFTISGWLGVAYLGIQGMKYADILEECGLEINKQNLDILTKIRSKKLWKCVSDKYNIPEKCAKNILRQFYALFG